MSPGADLKGLLQRLETVSGEVLALRPGRTRGWQPGKPGCGILGSLQPPSLPPKTKAAGAGRVSGTSLPGTGHLHSFIHSIPATSLVSSFLPSHLPLCPHPANSRYLCQVWDSWHTQTRLIQDLKGTTETGVGRVKGPVRNGKAPPPKAGNRRELLPPGVVALGRGLEPCQTPSRAKNAPFLLLPLDFLLGSLIG